MGKAVKTLLALTCFGGWLLAGLFARDNGRLTGQVWDLEVKLAAGASACAPVYGLWWVDRRCEGVLLGMLPATVQAFVCPARIRVYRAADPESVRARAQALGAGQSPPPLALEERGVRERELRLYWKAEVESQER